MVIYMESTVHLIYSFDNEYFNRYENVEQKSLDDNLYFITQ